MKNAANANGIRIMGDVPFYVGVDSVDVWAGKKNFFSTQMEDRSLSRACRRIISARPDRDGGIQSMTGSI